MTERIAYLTIDDSPSSRMDDMVDALEASGVPAIFFCRGDLLEKNRASVTRAIKKGFIAANHAYNHRRSSQISFDEVTAEITATQKLLDQCWADAGMDTWPKYFRFPHMDRGTGGWVVDFQKVPDEHRDILIKLFADGLNVSMDPPSEEAKGKKAQLQLWLKSNGFTKPAFNNVALPWYRDTEMAQAIDAMFTFSTSDWMITPRHKGNWPYKTLDDLKAKIDNDPWLQRTDTAHIILAHDQADIVDDTLALVDHMLDRGFKFKI